MLGMSCQTTRASCDCRACSASSPQAQVGLLSFFFEMGVGREVDVRGSVIEQRWSERVEVSQDASPSGGHPVRGPFQDDAGAGWAVAGIPFCVVEEGKREEKNREPCFLVWRNRLYHPSTTAFLFITFFFFFFFFRFATRFAKPFFTLRFDELRFLYPTSQILSLTLTRIRPTHCFFLCHFYICHIHQSTKIRLCNP
ncbi:hypothetical protein IWZ03DRAFT_93832 [Phyllosticta citriasiana]|uniref:Uncharacterized protein n=1 Tax=Phyllosticta citriasiana TaxID=595635 RepID=A0ABR1K7N8_9PEZI